VIEAISVRFNRHAGVLLVHVLMSKGKGFETRTISGTFSKFLEKTTDNR